MAEQSLLTSCAAAVEKSSQVALCVVFPQWRDGPSTAFSSRLLLRIVSLRISSGEMAFELLERSVEIRVGRALFFDLVDGIHHRRVMLVVELLSDIGK